MNFKIVIPVLTGSLLLATVARAESSFGQSFFSKQKPAIIAVAAENLPLSGNNTGVGPLVADAMRSACSAYGAQIAAIEPISLNSDIDSGNVSANDCKGIVRGNPQIAVVSMTGANIKKALEDVVSLGMSVRLCSVSPYVSGLRFSLDTGAVAGSRVSGLEVGSVETGYLPLDTSAIYKAALTAPAALSLWALRMAKSPRLCGNMDNAITAYITMLGKQGPIVNCRENRVNTTRATIAVFSDAHYFAPSLLVSDGVAFQTYLAQDRKLIAESHAIALETASRIRQSHPDICLVTGDLTKDGELQSDQEFSKILADSLKSTGIKVYVIPGNHDINNPEAYSYNGSAVTPVANVSPVDFTTIYKDFGFGDAIYRDDSSLTYIVQPMAGLWVLGIDACKYKNNVGHSNTGGALSPSTLAWIISKLDYARANNITVLGMMHHGLTEHFTGQSTMMMGIFKDYVIDNWTWLRDTLAGHGMKTVFTGHFHANDITERVTPAGSFVYDIETGSTVTWPCPFRTMSLSPERILTIATSHIDKIDYDTKGLPFQTYAEQTLRTGMTNLVDMTLVYQFGVPAAQAQALAPLVSNAWVAHYAGDETPSPVDIYTYSALKASPDPLTQGMGYALQSLWTDLSPSDNSLTIDLKSGVSN